MKKYLNYFYWPMLGTAAPMTRTAPMKKVIATVILCILTSAACAPKDFQSSLTLDSDRCNAQWLHRANGIELTSDSDSGTPRLTLRSRMFVTIQTNTVGRLENSSGRVLITSDDDGSGNNFGIRGVLEPGTYYIRVAGFQNLPSCRSSTGEGTSSIRVAGHQNTTLNIDARAPRDGDPVIGGGG